LGRGRRDGAGHKKANDPVKFTQYAGVEAKVVKSADGNLNAPGKIAGCHALLQGKTPLGANAVDGFGP
jgi:hypothetical protein